MGDLDMEMAKTIIEQTDGVLKEAYKDVVSPSAKPIGVMLSLLPRTIRLGLSKWEKWIINGEESLKLTAEALNDKVKSIPEEKQCEPEPYVAVPAIQQIAYCYDSEVLRNLYANLLASSMNIDKKWSVHPSFVDIIKQITPDEAKILKVLPRHSNKYIPLVDIMINTKNKSGSRVCARNIVNPELYEVCDVQDNMSSYLENLERLQLIKIPEGTWITERSVYERIEKSERVVSIKSVRLPADQFIDISQKLLYVTDFGVSFIKCCIDG